MRYVCFLFSTSIVALAASPALAQIAAPAGDTGVWAAVNSAATPLIVTVVGAAVTWASAQIARLTGIRIKTELEEQVRQTALTGVYKGVHDLELKLDEAWTLQQRQAVINKAVGWVMQRMPGPAGALARLGIGGDVVSAIVVKMLGTALSQNPLIDVSQVGGAAPESPAMARVTGSSAR